MSISFLVPFFPFLHSFMRCFCEVLFERLRLSTPPAHSTALPLVTSSSLKWLTGLHNDAFPQFSCPACCSSPALYHYARTPNSTTRTLELVFPLHYLSNCCPNMSELHVRDISHSTMSRTPVVRRGKNNARALRAKDVTWRMFSREMKERSEARRRSKVMCRQEELNIYLHGAVVATTWCLDHWTIATFHDDGLLAANILVDGDVPTRKPKAWRLFLPRESNSVLLLVTRNSAHS